MLSTALSSAPPFLTVPRHPPPSAAATPHCIAAIKKRKGRSHVRVADDARVLVEPVARAPDVRLHDRHARLRGGDALHERVDVEHLRRGALCLERARGLDAGPRRGQAQDELRGGHAHLAVEVEQRVRARDERVCCFVFVLFLL